MAYVYGDGMLEVQVEVVANYRGALTSGITWLRLRLDRYNHGDGPFSVLTWEVLWPTATRGTELHPETISTLLRSLATGQQTQVGHVQVTVQAAELPDFNVWLDQQLEQGSLSGILHEDGHIDVHCTVLPSSGQIYTTYLHLKLEGDSEHLTLLWDFSFQDAPTTWFRVDGERARAILWSLLSGNWTAFGRDGVRISPMELPILSAWLDKQMETGSFAGVGADGSLVLQNVPLLYTRNTANLTLQTTLASDSTFLSWVLTFTSGPIQGRSLTDTLTTDDGAFFVEGLLCEPTSLDPYWVELTDEQRVELQVWLDQQLERGAWATRHVRPACKGRLSGFKEKREASPLHITDRHMETALDNKATVIAWMRPIDFLTLTNDPVETMKGTAGGYAPQPLDRYNAFAAARENIIMASLHIDKDGVATGHEGRHRALALMQAAPDARMPVALFLWPLSRSTRIEDLPRILWPHPHLPQAHSSSVYLGPSELRDGWMVQRERDVLEHAGFQFSGIKDEEDELWSRYYQGEYWVQMRQPYFTYDPSIDAATARSWLEQKFPRVLTAEFEEGSPYRLMQPRETKQREAVLPTKTGSSLELTENQRYYLRRKQDPAFIERKRQRQRQYIERLKKQGKYEQHLKRNADKKRSTPEGRERLRDYEHQRWLKIKADEAALEKHREASRRWYKKLQADPVRRKAKLKQQTEYQKQRRKQTR